MLRRTLLALLLLLSLAACTQKPKKEFRRYELEGKVVAVDAAAKKLTISHKDIPGLMKGMTMDFSVKADWIWGKVQKGDQISAVLVMDPDGAYLENVSLTSQSSTPDASTAPVHMPEVGEAVPEFQGYDQNGAAFKLSKLRGKPVLLTFIYTRCPLPDYCIRMSSNFAEIEKRLKQEQPAIFSKLQVVSVSIDPEFDKPPVLKQYAKNYGAQVFPNWHFVSGKPEDVRKFANFFGLSYFPENNQITHSLRTALIAPDGKITALYSGNQWKPEEVLAQLK